MNIRNNPELREKLSAEYALGTLRGAARRRFESWLARDAGLRSAVAEWQGRLACLAELGHPVTPPGKVWDGIERRLWSAQTAPWWQFWRQEGARPWGALAIAASGVAVALAFVLAGQPRQPASQQMAALTDAQAHTALVVTADAKRGKLDVRVAQDVQVPADRSLQLWAITREGKPRSLGVLPENRHAELALSALATGNDVALLAISLEPKGGSPDPNGPTGPVLYKGSWTRL
jgi:anti-sigma-K factor RskA